MLRGAAAKVMWVGRATVFLVGLAVILGLVFGVAATALAGTGVGATFNLGKTNTVNALSSLVGSAAGPLLKVDNNGAGPALDLQVGATTASPASKATPPMRVDSQARVANLNADLLDGQEAGDLAEPRGYAHVTPQGAIDPNYPSKGVNGVVRVVPEGQTGVYHCFDLAFVPDAAVGSPFITNSGVVATVTRGNPVNSHLGSTCPATHQDAAARTYGSDIGADAPINYQIVFE